MILFPKKQRVAEKKNKVAEPVFDHFVLKTTKYIFKTMVFLFKMRRFSDRELSCTSII